MSRPAIRASIALLLIGFVAGTSSVASAWPRAGETHHEFSSAPGSLLSRQAPVSFARRKHGPQTECYADCIFGGMTNGFCAKSCGRIF
jgi:hypothetical protein